ncbi:hypothetical protein ACFX2I_011225 [Malus domestica]|uniref:uncharacterized protein n=1 Tax=Malus domestica TaxID=3750 RepID=UPI000498722A|nr:uncharacterized protein LOC103451771 [Malus domestica]
MMKKNPTMEEEDQNDQNQKKKFVCRFCSKRFRCGKSLGGHIRTHLKILNKKPVIEKEEEEEDDEIIAKAAARIVKFSPFDGGNSGYSLRENPKKTWRFSDAGPTFQLQQEKVCKECGKGFQSLKALCGHMACHSEKEKLMNKFEEISEFSEKQKLLDVMDSQSDTETSAPPRQRRISKRLKQQNLDVYSSVANGGSSSGGSGIEQEQQEVALSLMMLSRDSGGKGGLNSFAESSDNNSVILEAKSSSIDMRINTKEGLNCAYKVSDVMGMKRVREKKLKSEEIEVSDNSDSGYFRHEQPKKVDSDVSVDGFFRNGEFHKGRAEFGSRIEGYESYDVKLRKGFRVESELGKDVSNAEARSPDQVHRDRGTLKYALRKTTKNTTFHRPIVDDSSNVEPCRNARKSGKYECLTCNKTFHSHRALGGHRASHTKTNAYSESIYESGENSVDTDPSPVLTPESSKLADQHCSGKKPMNDQDFSGSAKRSSETKKSKGHECPFCFKVFKSGQALGGHKRSHFVGGCEVKTVVLGQQEPDQPPPHEAEITARFDLNLPAPMEDEANDHFGYMAW